MHKNISAKQLMMGEV
jgi:hypothetical protein